MMLQIAGAPDGVLVTVSYMAEVLSLRHHTVVELSKRCESAGYVRRTQDRTDRRCVVLKLTKQGEDALHQLSDIHALQLRELAPSLIKALTQIRNSRQTLALPRKQRSDMEKHS